jgi:hypothetical protein
MLSNSLVRPNISLSVAQQQEVHSLKLPAIGPYQTTHTYAKKGKQTVEVTFCAQVGKCDAGCTTYSKTIGVLP